MHDSRVQHQGLRREQTTLQHSVVSVVMTQRVHELFSPSCEVSMTHHADKIVDQQNMPQEPECGHRPTKTTQQARARSSWLEQSQDETINRWTKCKTPGHEERELSEI